MPQPVLNLLERKALLQQNRCNRNAVNHETGYAAGTRGGTPLELTRNVIRRSGEPSSRQQT